LREEATGPPDGDGHGGRGDKDIFTVAEHLGSRI
jgi:hypothetical protein